MRICCGGVGISLFTQGTSNRNIGNGLRLCRERFRLGIRNYFFIKRIAKHWNWLPREEEGHHPCRNLKGIDRALRDMAGGDIGVGGLRYSLLV